MSSSHPDHWSLTRSLAFLAATFAIVFATLLPSAVAATPATGLPMVLCSDAALAFSAEAAAEPRPSTPVPIDSLECASSILVATTALLIVPDSDPVAVPAGTSIDNAGFRPGPAAVPAAPAPRPPSTAPPTA